MIDITIEENGKYILIILDDMEWYFGIRQEHARILQDKVNNYLTYIAGGQAEEARPGLRPVIRILAQYPYSNCCISFLERIRAFIKRKDDICDIEWTHPRDEGPFEDGFSDDYVDRAKPEKSRDQKERCVLAMAVYLYIRENHSTGCQVKWEDWLDSHSETVTVKPGETIDTEGFSSDPLVVSDSMEALSVGQATVLSGDTVYFITADEKKN